MPLQSKLPVITFDKQTLNQSSDDWLLTCHAVRQALEDYGCFVVSTDKISCGLRNAMFEHIKDMFQLPIETKMNITSDILGFGFGKHTCLPLFESMGMEISGTSMEPTRSFTDLLFPAGNTAFCETVFEYMKSLSEIHHCVMRMVIDSYGIEDTQLDNSSFYMARFMKYRAPTDQDEGEIGLSPHMDKNFLSVLDNNGVKGLEVRMKNGEWIYHEHSPSTFVVIAGDPLMAWSNGRIYAPLHQVAMRTSEKDVVRYSTGLFSFMKETIEVPEKLVDSEHYLRFRPFNNLEFLKYLNTEEGRASKNPIESYCGVTSCATIAN